MMLGQGASRNKGGSDTPFIASEIVEKAAELKRLSNQLSRLIDVATKLSPKQRDQAGEQWYASLPDRG